MTTSDTTIEIGDYVRSYDFSYNRFNDGPSACFCEGVVAGIAKIRGCDRYLISVHKRVMQGEDVGLSKAEALVFPPVNGTRTSLGDETDGVELLRRNVLEVE